ncbi:hypothetical protein RCL1_007014 [Eukaryota sp. TZLM3-RCL]
MSEGVISSHSLIDHQVNPSTWVHTGLFKLHFPGSRHNFWTTLLHCITWVQVIGFVARIIDFSPLFDLQPVFWLAVPVHGSGFITNDTVIPLVVAAALIILAVLVVTVFAPLLPDSSYFSVIGLKLCRVYLELVTSIGYIPLSSIVLSYIRCYGASHGPSFASGVEQYCNTNLGTLLIFSGFALFFILFVINCLNLLLVDDSQLSKNWFARAHPRVDFALLLTKSCFILVFFIFPSREWLFRIIFFLSSLFSLIVFTKYLPFYKYSTNIITSLFIGSWLGFSISFLIRSILITFNIYSATPGFDSLIFYGSMILFGIIGCFSVKYRWSYLIRKTALFQNYLAEFGLITEEGKVSLDFNPNQIDWIDVGITKPVSVYELELFSRALYPRPFISPYINAIRALYHCGEIYFPESLSLLCFKMNFECNVMKDHINASVTNQTIKSVGVEPFYDEEYHVYRLVRLIESLRRSQSVGSSVSGDSFLHLQKQLKHLNELHSYCIDGLYAFWSTLLSEKPDLSVLPNILEQISPIKKKLENSYKKLITSDYVNQTILNNYASFIREIQCDEQNALLLEEQASLLTSSDRSHSQGASSISASVTGPLAPKSKKKRSRFSTFSSFGMIESNQNRSAINSLRISVIIALLIILLLSIISVFLVSSVSSFSTVQLEQVYEASHIEFVSHWIGKSVNQLFSSTFSIISGSELAKKVLDASHHLTFHLRRLVYDGSLTDKICPSSGSRQINDPSSELQSLLISARFSVFTLLDLNPIQELVDVTSLWITGLRNALTASNIATNFLINEPVTPLSIEILSEDLRSTYSVFDLFYDYIVSKGDEFFQQSLFIQIIFAVIILSVIIGIGVFLFGKSFAKINSLRIAILNLFLYVNKAEIQLILENPKFSSCKKTIKTRRGSSIQSVFDLGSEDSESDSISKCAGTTSPNLVLPEPGEFDLTVNIGLKSPKSQEDSLEIRPVPIRFRILSALLCLFLFIFVLLFFFNSQNLEENANDISTMLEVAISVRSNAADLTLLDRRLSTFVQLFSYNGDNLWLLNYFDILNNGERIKLLENLLSLELTASELFNLGQANSIIREMRHLEQISLTLSSSVFPVDSSILPLNYSYCYDSEQETDFARKKIASYPAPVRVWYTNTNDDLALPVDLKIDLSRHTVCSPRWLTLFLELMNFTEATADSVTESRLNSILSSLQLVFSQVLLGWIYLLIIFLLAIGSFTVVFLHRKSLRFGLLFLYIVGAIFILFLIISAYFLININQTSRSLEQSTTEGIKMIVEAIRSEWFYLSVKRRAQLFAYEKDLSNLAPLITSQSNTKNYLEIFKRRQLCNLDSLNSICDDLVVLANSLEEQLKLPELAHNISIKLKLNTLNQSNSHYNDITWDSQSFSTEEINYFNSLPDGLSLTSSNHDLNLPLSHQESLSMAVVSSRAYEQSVDRVVSTYHLIRSTVISSVSLLITTTLESMTSSIQMNINVVLIVAFCFTLFTVVFVVSGSPKAAEFSHIKQKITISTTKKFTRQYIMALGIIFILLSLFFILSVIAFVSSRENPHNLSLISRRAALVVESLSFLSQFKSRPEVSRLSLTRASESIEKLLKIHHLLMKIQISSTTELEDLTFSSEFSGLSRDNSTQYGLHKNLVNFVLNARSFIHLSRFKELSNSEFDQIFSIGELLENQVLESIDIMYSHYDLQVEKNRQILLSVFIFFILFLGVSYFGIFRIMLNKLSEEEVATIDFLNMLHDNIIENSTVIRDFLAKNNL